jgi:HSP20 family protein
MRCFKSTGDLFPKPPFGSENERLFNSFWLKRGNEQLIPTLTIMEGVQAFNIELAAPGFIKSEFNVNFYANVIVITAEKKDEHFTGKRFTYSSFSRSFTLPQGVDTSKVDINYSNGILQLIIPKRANSQKKEIATR